MTINDMRAAIKSRYSARIRGQMVDAMSDSHIYAIYHSMVDRNDVEPPKVKRVPKKDRLHEPIKYEQMRMEI